FEAAWLYKIAHNVCLSKHAGTARRARVEAPQDLQLLEERVAAPDVEQSRVELAGLDDALASMPENLRRAILLREWQGLSYAEIADELGLSQSAVETLIFRARRYLARALDTSVKQPARRIASALNLGPIVAAIRSWLAGAGAVKLGAGAVVVAAGLAGGGVAVSQSLGSSTPERAQPFAPPTLASVREEPPVAKARPVQAATPVRAKVAKPKPESHLLPIAERLRKQHGPVHATQIQALLVALGAAPATTTTSASVASAPAAQAASAQTQTTTPSTPTRTGKGRTHGASPAGSVPAQTAETVAGTRPSSTTAAGGGRTGTPPRPPKPPEHPRHGIPVPPVDTNPESLVPPVPPVTVPPVTVPKATLPTVPTVTVPTEASP